MPFFSIIVPVYNTEKYLKQCLDSVLSQTFTDFECILIDDGSPDACPPICDDYAARDNRFVVIHQENAGLSAARNAGIRKASGEYIVLLDSDDLYCTNDSLHYLYAVIQETKVPVIFNSNGSDIVDGKLVTFDEYPDNVNVCKAEVFYDLSLFGHFPGWKFVIQRLFLLEHNLFFMQGIFNEDLHWVPRVVCTADVIVINHYPYYCYRKLRQGSITGAKSIKKSFYNLIIIDDLLSLAKQTKLNKQASYKSKIYKDRCKGLWMTIFCEIQVYKKNSQNQYIKVCKHLKKISYILLHRATINSIFLFILITIVGVGHAMNIRNFIHQMRKYNK
ncbi:MAG: glycosyltransferase [Treponemataceae bacterium]|nr:MAG: glycosyltransferase [Treponemataceae bacterium]